MTLPGWLRDRIGTPTYRGVTHHRCRTCKAQILEGLDEDVCAFRATVDPDPLTPLGEALALIADRRTYELRRHSRGWALWHRDRWQITGRVAGSKYLVVADHQCHTAKLPTIPTPPRVKKAKANDEPTF